MKLKRLDHFGLDVTDPARAEKFYTELLGMTVEMRLPDQVLLRYGDGACALFLEPDRLHGEDIIRDPAHLSSPTVLVVQHPATFMYIGQPLRRSGDPALLTIVMDRDGDVLTGTLMDYAVPRAELISSPAHLPIERRQKNVAQMLTACYFEGGRLFPTP